MEYNTQRERLPLPEYGRSVQNMVDHALTIEDRAERQRCAETIIAIMGNMYPQLRDLPDFRHKLWDHLAIMSDFRLDIDYPFEVVRKGTLEGKPDKVPYSDSHIRYRHYGRFIEELIAKAMEYPEGEERNRLTRMIASHMKRDFAAWNKEGVEDQKIFDDIAEYSDGAIRMQGTLPSLNNGQNVQRNNFSSRKRNGKQRKY